MSNWQGGPPGGGPPPGNGPPQPGYGPPQQQQPGYGPPQQQPPGYGPPHQQPPQPGYAPALAQGYGSPPVQGYAPQPAQGFGPTQQPQPGYGPPQQPQPGYGPSPQPMVPAAMAAMAGPGAQTVMGVPLQPGERVIYIYKPSYTVDKVMYWICGVLLALVLVGIIFIVLAVLVDKRNPKAQIVTNQRVIEISGKGVVQSIALSDVIELKPKRQQANSGGGGLVGFAIGMAVNAVANSLAERNSMMTPAFWKRTIGIEIIGRTNRIHVQTRDPLKLGPLVARCVYEPGSAETMPAVQHDA